MESLLPPQTVQESWQTIARATRQYGRFVRQTGGMCHFGLVTLAIRPTPHTPDISIAFELPVEEIPREYWAAVWQGIREELRDKRPNENWAGLEILVIGGAYHPVDSNEISYRMAGREASPELFGMRLMLWLGPKLQLTQASVNGMAPHCASNLQLLLTSLTNPLRASLNSMASLIIQQTSGQLNMFVSTMTYSKLWR